MNLSELVKETDIVKASLMECFLVSDREASSFLPLNITVDDNKPTSYDSKKQTFNFKNRKKDYKGVIDEETDILLSIGEEVSHYLHHQINPAVWKDIPSEKLDLYHCMIEFIGHYGMLCLYAKRGKEIPKIPIVNEVVMADDPSEFNTLIIHKVGYTYAHECFKKYQATKLPTLARMQPEPLEKHLWRIAPITWIHKHLIPIYDAITKSPYRSNEVKPK